ncbi:MAG: PAS domain S-box protein [Halobacteriota archaeon]
MEINTGSPSLDAPPSPRYVSGDKTLGILEAATQPFIVLDRDLVIRQANTAFFSAFRLTRTGTVGTLFSQLGEGQWAIPELLRMLREVVEAGTSITDYRVEFTFEIGCRTLSINATPLLDDEMTDQVLLEISDITELELLRLQLKGEKEFSQTVIDDSREALVILDLDLRVKIANEAFYTQFQLVPGESEGRVLYELGGGQWNIPKLRILLDEILPGNGAFTDYVIEQDFPNLSRRVMLLNARRVDHLQFIILAIEDITERHRYDGALRASEERLRKVLETEAVGVIFFDHSGVLFDCNDSFLHMTGYARDDVQSRSLTWRLLTPEPWIKASEDALEALRRTGRIGPYEKEYLLKDGSTLWMIFAGRDLGDGTTVEFCVDISDRKKAEEQRDLLTLELSHRVKNTLAVVQSLAMLSGLKAKSVDEYRSAFLGRLHALSSTQTLLIDSQSQTADVRTLVENAVAAFRNSTMSCFEIEGGSVIVNARRSVGLALILHELGTNAVKHGALSQPSGRVTISWDSQMIDGHQYVDMTWRERDGPEVKEPTSQGFGSKLIGRSGAMELEGKVDFDFAPSGLICRLTFPTP